MNRITVQTTVTDEARWAIWGQPMGRALPTVKSWESLNAFALSHGIMSRDIVFEDGALAQMIERCGLRRL